MNLCLCEMSVLTGYATAPPPPMLFFIVLRPPNDFNMPGTSGSPSEEIFGFLRILAGLMISLLPGPGPQFWSPSKSSLLVFEDIGVVTPEQAQCHSMG